MCDTNTKNTKLERAVRSNNLEELKALLSDGADVNVRVQYFGFRHKETLLHCANDTKILKELLLRGANVNATNEYRETPLHAAITLGKDLEFVRELLKHGAAVNATNRKGNTALNHAVKRNSRMEIIEELLKYGADIHIKNCEHRFNEDCYSSLDNAMRHPNQAKLLLKYDLLRNFKSDNQRSIDLNTYENSPETSYLSSYLSECVCEIIKMRTDDIRIGLPLYDFVTKKINIRHLPNLNSLSLRLSKIDYSLHYPIYNDIILYEIKPFLKRAALLKKLERIQIYTLNSDQNGIEIILTPHSISLIAEYLSSDDLLNLIFASKNCNIHFTNLMNNLADIETGINGASTSKDAKRARLL